LIQLQKPAGNLPDSAELILNFANETNLSRNNQGTLSDGNAANDKGTRIVIPLIAKLNGSGQITDCGPSVSETNEAAREKFCLSLGAMAFWDVLATPKTCKFRTAQCPHGQVPKIQDSAGTKNQGTIECVPLSEQMNASDLFDTTPCPSPITASTTFQIVNQGGKLRLRCN
jgi:hypothetical protein